MAVKLALRKNDPRIISRFIQWWTNSIYSHCELVVDGVSYSSSAMDGGVRAKCINYDTDKWDFLELPWVRPESVIDYFQLTDDYKYGWGGLVTSQLFNLNRTDKSTTFCSQWCAAAVGLPSPASYSPATLGALCGFVGNLIAPNNKELVDETITRDQE